MAEMGPDLRRDGEGDDIANFWFTTLEQYAFSLNRSQPLGRARPGHPRLVCTDDDRKDVHPQVEPAGGEVYLPARNTRGRTLALGLAPAIGVRRPGLRRFFPQACTPLACGGPGRRLRFSRGAASNRRRQHEARYAQARRKGHSLTEVTASADLTGLTRASRVEESRYR